MNKGDILSFGGYFYEEKFPASTISE